MIYYELVTSIVDKAKQAKIISHVNIKKQNLFNIVVHNKIMLFISKFLSFLCYFLSKILKFNNYLRSKI